MMHHRSIVSLFLLAVAMTVAPAANAAMIWTTELETTGESVNWSSDTALDPGYAEYQYTYQITQVDVLLDSLTAAFLGVDPGWNSAIDLGLFNADDLTGTGSFGSFPVTLISETISETVGIWTLSANFVVEIDADGYGQASLTNIDLGPFDGLRYASTINIVPEPASLALLAGGGSLMLLRRRRTA